MKCIYGMHLYKSESVKFKIKSDKKYTWFIPEKLEKEISKGDIVLALCKNTKAPVIVLDIFESEEEKSRHKKIIKILDKNKK